MSALKLSIVGFCWWNEGWQNDDHKKHDSDLIILHDPDLTRVFREDLAVHADRIQETPILAGQVGASGAHASSVH